MMRSPRSTTSRTAALALLLLPSALAAPPRATAVGFHECAPGRHRAMRGGLALLAEGSGFAFVTAHGDVVRVAPEGRATPAPAPAATWSPRDVLPGRVHLLRGEPSRHRAHLPHFRELRLERAFPGADLVLRADARRFTFDVARHAGASEPESFAFETGLPAELDSGGGIVFRTPGGELRIDAPRAFATGNGGGRTPLPASVEMNARGFTLHVGAAPPAHDVVLDPGVDFVTYAGGSQTDAMAALFAFPDGSCIVAGSTLSPDFPVTANALDPQLSAGFFDGLVARYDGQGALVSATFLGGSASDHLAALAVDGAGRPHVGGRTESFDWPVTPGALDTGANGAADAVVAQLSADGSTLLRSTFLGGSFHDEVRGLALGPSGAVFATGATASPDFPATPGAFDPTFAGGSPLTDGFLARLEPSFASLGFSTFLGGSAIDEGRSVAQRAGRVLVGGRTDSADLPVAQALQPAFGGGLNDGYLAAFDAASGQLQLLTYLGGSASDTVDAVAIDGTGRLLATGRADSQDFGVTGGFDPFHGGGEDAYLIALAPDGATQAFGTFLGGSGNDRGLGLALDGFDAPYVVGRTTSPNFPVLQTAVDTSYGGQGDAFFVKLRPSAMGLYESTYFGGSGEDELMAVGVDAEGAALCAGRTTSTNLAVTAGAQQGASAGGGDAFLARLLTTVCPAPPEVTVFGTGKAGINGVPSLTAKNQPVVPSTDFQVQIANGLAGAPPLLFIGVLPLALPFDGGTILVNPVFVLGLPPLDAMGRLVLPLPAEENPALCGATLLLQSLWLDPAAGGFYSTAQTNGLRIVFGS